MNLELLCLVDGSELGFVRRRSGDGSEPGFVRRRSGDGS